ncbi:Fe-S cluster assembly protein SufD [Cytophagales bacterium LB-30]|uniref:Fe-S cluster assembly protein SufD n=1 Tax=Shiella aurantiaca TaxID=3058365 RepID=A0ABT8F1K4_9BACT|nr:Fe-S cluster assembly protein SufD [Shiella aurantiaca]MDN4163911.1 Fe-S cluster assembly protein SufD [Shiella aurantiaca]
MQEVLNQRIETAKASASYLPSEERTKAMTWLQANGLPHAKAEEYKYTHLTKVLEKEFSLQAGVAKSVVTKEQLSGLLFESVEAHHVVLVDGVFAPELSRIAADSKQLEISAFHEAQQKPAYLQYAAKEAHAEADPFIALNTAFASNGLFIEVKRGAAVELPVILYHISSASDAKPVIYPRNLIVVGENAQVKLVEHYITLGEAATFTNSVTEIVCQQDALVDYYKLQFNNPSAHQVGTTQVLQVKKSVFTATTVSLDGKMLRNNLNIVMDDEHCESNMWGLYLLNGKSHVDNHTMVDHRKPNALSNENYKGIMDGNSTAVFNGKIFVRQDAQKTNAFQSNRNILLSNDASVNTKPQLEIWADDVKCSHGCTIGQMDEEQLFYLRARGLSYESARAMLLHAFAADVIQNIKIEGIRTLLEELIIERLSK